MNDPIDRQTAIDAVYKCADIFVGDMPVMVVKSDAYEALAQLPSAQPEIVRCKDCKWFGDIGCAIRIYDDTDKPSKDDYCSFAERKGNG